MCESAFKKAFLDYFLTYKKPLLLEGAGFVSGLLVERVDVFAVLVIGDGGEDVELCELLELLVVSEFFLIHISFLPQFCSASFPERHYFSRQKRRNNRIFAESACVSVY